MRYRAISNVFGGIYMYVEPPETQIEELEKKIHEVYDQSRREMKVKIDKYWDKLKEKDKKMRDQLKQGKITQKQYDDWKAAAVMHGKRQEAVRDALAKDLTNTNIIAMAIVNDATPDIYALNYNYAAYNIESELEMGISYTIYDRNAVNRLIAQNPDLLPAPKVNIPVDQRWNKQKITSAITQGILQGESIDMISKRLQGVSDMNRKAATRNARTAVTGAQNAGRVDSYRHAEEHGIQLVQEWIATLDSRTRHSHAILDGEQRKVGEKFSNGLMYPGDPNGAPSEVYCCRCTLRGVIKGTSFPKGKYGNGKLGNMSYDEWKDLHRRAADGDKEAEKILRPPKPKKENEDKKDSKKKTKSKKGKSKRKRSEKS